MTEHMRGHARAAPIGETEFHDYRILGATSPGGHLVELEAIAEMLSDAQWTVAAPEAPLHMVHVRHFRITDCNARTPLRLLRCLFQLRAILREIRPHLVISTGAAPGALALWLAHRAGVKTVWIDCVANTECPSLSGRLVRPAADVWIGQWAEACHPQGGLHFGKIFDLRHRRDSAPVRPPDPHDGGGDQRGSI